MTRIVRSRWAAALAATLLQASGVSCSNTSITQINGDPTVGAKGATVGNPSATHVVIPAGALTQDTVIRVSEVPEAQVSGLAPLPSGLVAASRVFAFEPHGQTFGTDVTIAIALSGPPGGTLVLLRAELPTSPSWIEVPIQEADSLRVIGASRGFSLYRVARRVDAADAGQSPDSGPADTGASAADTGVGADSGSLGDAGSCASSELRAVKDAYEAFRAQLVSALTCNSQGSGQCPGNWVFQGLLDGETLTACYFLNVPPTETESSWASFVSAIRNVPGGVGAARGCLLPDPTCPANGCVRGCEAGSASCRGGFCFPQ